MTPHEKFAQHAASFEAVPFHHQGRSGAGLDCIGLVMVCAARCKVMVGGKPLKFYDRTDYGREPSPPYLDERLDACFQKVDDIEVGTILLFNIAKHPQHVGIVDNIEKGSVSFMHAYEPYGKVRRDSLDGRWMQRLNGIYRIPFGCFPKVGH